jgi:hypothetical protein
MPGGVEGIGQINWPPLSRLYALRMRLGRRTEARGYGLWRYRHGLPSDAVRAAGRGYDR